MQLLLLNSNNLTWTQTVVACDPTVQKEIFETLSKTRYSSRSLKKLQVTADYEDYKQDVLSFLQSSCEVLETLEIRGGNTILSLAELASCRALTNSLNRLVWESQSIPDSPHFQHFNSLQEVCLLDTEINDEELHPFASLKNLRRLELNQVNSCTGSFLDVVCPSLKKLRILEIRYCYDFDCVSGLKHLANSMVELSLIKVRRLNGHEEWVEFPYLKKLDLARASFVQQEKCALSLDAFPSLNVLDLHIEFKSDLFYAKILNSCQRENSSAPMKRINIDNQLTKENLDALLMVPVEELELVYPHSTQHVSSDIPWSEEKQ